MWALVCARGLAALLLVAASCCAQDTQASPADAGQQPSPDLVIVPDSLPTCMLGEQCERQLQARGGIPPFRWAVKQGDLPPDLHLDAGGLVSGTSSSAGDYTFTVAVDDSSSPPLHAERGIRLSSRRPLLLTWKTEPHPDGRAIAGTAEVSNGSKDDLDLTFIVLAVNEYGKAFALGYQRLSLPPDKSQVIEFQSNVPAGTYNVHADAVAEVPSKNLIRRAWLETAAPLAMSSEP
jgi:putative Ig domain-containing protein